MVHQVVNLSKQDWRTKWVPCFITSNHITTQSTQTVTVIHFKSCVTKIMGKKPSKLHWQYHPLPHDWNFRIICTILKKGDPMARSNDRGILLLNTAYKILSYIICARLSKYTERIIGKYQCCFRNNQSDLYLKSNYGKDSWISNWSTSLVCWLKISLWQHLSREAPMCHDGTWYPI